MGFFSILEQRCREVDSLVCIGLDPHPADLPAASPQAVRDFCLRLIESTASLAGAYKPNSAFFEAFGSQGIAVLQEVIAAVPHGIPVILDVKRGDIASTAEAYARSAFDILGAGAVTLNPYLGRDSLDPFISNPEHGAFLLCKTSNLGAADLQDLPVTLPRRPGWPIALYEVVARLAQSWNQSDNIGLVVGATHPLALERVRRLTPELWILAPGVGAQGGDLEAALRAGLRADGWGLLIPVSRAISHAADQRLAAMQLRDQINRLRDVIRQDAPAPGAGLPSGPAFDGSLADGLLEAGCVKFGEFTLKSGLVSPIYLDLRRLVGFPRLLEAAARAYVEVLRKLSFDRLAALPYAALPIGTAISLAGGWPMIYPRKEVKEYGTRVEIEGEYIAGEKVVVIDDLATTGGSKFEAIHKLAAAGLVASDVVVLIDRQSGAAESLAEKGFRLHSVFTLMQLLDYWENSGKVPSYDLARARAFLNQA